MGVTHAFVSAKDNPADATLVRPQDWNAAHEGMPVNSWYNAYPDYGSSRNAATAQAAINACVAGGGGTVFLDAGTWALGSTSLTIGGDDVKIQGAGPYATVLTYSGTSGAIKNSDSATTRYYCGAEDLQIDISAGGTGSSCLQLDNFYCGTWRGLRLESANSPATDSDCIRLVGTAAHKTYFNHFDHLFMEVQNGACLHFTGGGVNRNFFTNLTCYGVTSSSYFVLMVPTATTHDTNMFVDCSMQGTVHDPFLHLVYTSPTEVCYYNTFVNIIQETTAGTETVVVDDGNTYNQFIGGYIRAYSPGSYSDRNMIITPSRTSLCSVYLGFYTATPITKPTVTGSKGSNAALTSLCTALANLGLITNSTT